MLPWAEMFRAGLRLGLSPSEFWSLSLREWRWLAAPSDRPMVQSTLYQLMSTYPDTEKSDE